MVKRLKKKNIKVNEKVIFDEEGNRIAEGINVQKSINTTDILAEEVENKKEKVGYSGINIEEAKKLLQDEDKYDKQLYRERIKRMHRVELNQAKKSPF